MATTKCFLCGNPWASDRRPREEGHRTFFSCSRCGTYCATKPELERLETLGLGARRSLMRALEVAPTNFFADTPQISANDIDAAERKPISVMQMADRLLAYCVRRSSTLGHSHRTGDKTLLKPCYAIQTSELVELVEYFKERGFAREGIDVGAFWITPLGYKHVEEMGAAAGDSNQAFVAMKFASTFNDVFQSAMEPAIRDCGYTALRIDRKEHNQKIDDEMIGEIRKSRFLVADLTGHSGGVYFEAGFAMGLGLPVIWTCRRSDMADLHFDVRQYNCIDWDDISEFRLRLKNRISALLGQGKLETS